MKKLLCTTALIYLLATPAYSAGIDRAKEGLALAEQGFYKEATASFERALGTGDLTKEQKAKTLYNLGTSQLTMGHPDRAITSFKQAQKLDPSNADNLLNLSLAYLKLGQPKKAKDAALSSLKIKQHPSGYYHAGLAYLAMSKNQQALSNIKAAIEASPDNKDYQLAYGKALLANRKYKDAEKTLTKILQANAWDAEAYVYRALAWRGQGQNAKARADLTTAASIAPNNPFVRETYKLNRWSDDERNIQTLKASMDAYASASKKAPVMTKLYKGQKTEILSCDDTWCAIETAGSFAGYVPSITFSEAAVKKGIARKNF